MLSLLAIGLRGRVYKLELRPRQIGDCDRLRRTPSLRVCFFALEAAAAAVAARHNYPRQSGPDHLCSLFTPHPLPIPLQNADHFSLNTAALEDGKGKCPYDPAKSYTGLIVGEFCGHVNGSVEIWLCMDDFDCLSCCRQTVCVCLFTCIFYQSKVQIYVVINIVSYVHNIMYVVVVGLIS